jgi:hypothetical protein
MGVEKILRHFEHNITMTNEDAKKKGWIRGDGAKENEINWRQGS